MSIDIFQQTKSGRRDSINNVTPPQGRLITTFPYDLSTFGHERGFVRFMASNYSLNEDVVRGIIIDRNFIYGRREDQTNIANIQGIKNLYERVVQVFRERFVEEARRYVNFPRQWRRPISDANPNGTMLSTEIGVTQNDLNNLSARDRQAIIEYGTTNGVPYFWAGKPTYQKLADAYSTLPSNWNEYSTGQKPFSEFGIDCSGLIMNCLLDVRHCGTDNESFFIDGPTENSYRTWGENAQSMGNWRVKEIPLTIINEVGMASAHTLIQSADLIYTNAHIALCAIDEDMYISKEQITPDRNDFRFFNIIHNYGDSGIWTNNEAAENLYVNGFFRKTLYGPFRHWGVDFGSNNNQAKAGRIFLWY